MMSALAVLKSYAGRFTPFGPITSVTPPVFRISLAQRIARSTSSFALPGAFLGAIDGGVVFGIARGEDESVDGPNLDFELRYDHIRQACF